MVTSKIVTTDTHTLKVHMYIILYVEMPSNTIQSHEMEGGPGHEVVLST